MKKLFLCLAWWCGCTRAMCYSIPNNGRVVLRLRCLLPHYLTEFTRCVTVIFKFKSNFSNRHGFYLVWKHSDETFPQDRWLQQGEKCKWKCFNTQTADSWLLICQELPVAVNHVVLCFCLTTGGQCRQINAAWRGFKEQQQRGCSEYPGGDHSNLLQNLPQCRHLAFYQGTPLEETR